MNEHEHYHKEYMADYEMGFGSKMFNSSLILVGLILVIAEGLRFLKSHNGFNISVAFLGAFMVYIGIGFIMPVKVEDREIVIIDDDYIAFKERKKTIEIRWDEIEQVILEQKHHRFETYRIITVTGEDGFLLESILFSNDVTRLFKHYLELNNISIVKKAR